MSGWKNKIAIINFETVRSKKLIYLCKKNKYIILQWSCKKEYYFAVNLDFLEFGF